METVSYTHLDVYKRQELRRTGFPSGTPIGINNISGGKPPLRIPYVQSEKAANQNNIPVVDIFNTKIFWVK